MQMVMSSHEQNKNKELHLNIKKINGESKNQKFRMSLQKENEYGNKKKNYIYNINRKQKKI